jgi:hypothetical protein
VLPLSKRIDVSGHDPAIVAKGSRRGVPRPTGRPAIACGRRLRNL